MDGEAKYLLSEKYHVQIGFREGKLAHMQEKRIPKYCGRSGTASLSVQRIELSTYPQVMRLPTDVLNPATVRANPAKQADVKVRKKELLINSCIIKDVYSTSQEPPLVITHDR